jgi:hypothetical protein
MGLVLDGEGFPLASEIFAGNAREPKTLKTMIEQLSCVPLNLLGRPWYLMQALPHRKM